MGPIEIAILTGIAILLFGARLTPQWGRALGETLGYVRESTRDKI